MVTIWAKRYSHAYGWRWISERKCNDVDVNKWLDIFMKDEPSIIFIASQKKPKL